MMLFQSTRRCSDILAGRCVRSQISPFQSTHRCGAMIFTLNAAYSFHEFQSTHPCGVRHIITLLVLPIGSHAVPNIPLVIIERRWPTSILTKGPYLNHAPAWYDKMPKFELININPRTCVWCDVSAWHLGLVSHFQLMHPCYGCDKGETLPKPRTMGFNPRTRVGATHPFSVTVGARD